jgi:hypothetical protein
MRTKFDIYCCITSVSITFFIQFLICSGNVVFVCFILFYFILQISFIVLPLIWGFPNITEYNTFVNAMFNIRQLFPREATYYH